MRTPDITIRLDGAESETTLDAFFAQHRFRAADKPAFTRRLFAEGHVRFGEPGPGEIIVSLAVRPDRRPVDAYFVTHDGPIWPLMRHQMTTAAMIVLRMAEDLAEMIQRRGDDAVIEASDLVRVGWTGDQVDRHGHEAVGRIRTLAAALPRRYAA